ncbi:MAG: S8 family serine peptidase [Saprospiraceae bacterium]|nr:S8 family serine peptidase [Saprospiraceae bacterium]
MKNNHLLLCLLLLSTAAIGQKQFPSNYQPGTYMPGRVIFKLLPETRPALAMEAGQPKTYRLTDGALQKICAAQGPYSVKALFPQHWGRVAGKVDLSLIGELEFAETANVPALCRQLMATGQFEYVEPRIIYKTAGDPPANWADMLPSLALPPFTPNDPMVGQQWHLEKIKAFDAWDIEQGDTSVLIAIVDTGVDYDHPDLAGNIAVNYADPVNGLDDDGNGFVDDYLGWDFFSNDNDPKAGASHGSAVAGIAAAVTNNGLGLAAPGFNSRILAVKTSSDTPGDLNIPYGYEGIVYAADRGCRVINCSWGGPGSPNEYLDDIIRYATFDKNALVVSISHNQNADARYYPASAEFVLSVAATNADDVKESYSNFNHYVDISAPSTIWVTTPGGNYANGWNGTSFSAPQVSGAAAILAAYAPSLSAIQLGERLRLTADNIDAQNPNYVEKLGRGRLNMYRALTDAPSPAVRFTEAKFTDGNDDIFMPGDTIRLSGTFINYLADVADVTVTLSTPNTEIVFLDSTFSIGSLSTLSEVDNDNQPFQFVIGANIPLDTDLPIRLHFQAAGYDDWQWLGINTNRTFIDINNGIITTTITSEGRIGANAALEGLLFKYLPSDQILGVFALMLGNSSSRVSDAAPNDWSLPSPLSNDFKIVEPVRPATLPIADIDLFCTYNDSSAVPASAIMDLFVRQHTYAWTGDHFVIVEYEVTNNSTNEYNTFHAGLWGDIDVYPDATNNRAEQDTNLQLGYVYQALQPNPYMGIQVLGQSPFNQYVLQYSSTYGGVNILDNFSTAEKYKTLTESRPTGGFEDADGGDVLLVVSSGPYQLAPGATIKVAFALLAADSLEGLRSAAQDALLRYEDFTGTETPLVATAEQLKIYPNPAGDMIWIATSGMETGRNLDLEVYDLSGKMISRLSPTAAGGLMTVGTGQLPAGMYLLRLRTAAGVRTGKFIKQ